MIPVFIKTLKVNGYFFKGSNLPFSCLHPFIIEDKS